MIDFSRFVKKSETDSMNKNMSHITQYKHIEYYLEKIDINNISDNELCFIISQNESNILNNTHKYLKYFNDERFMNIFTNYINKSDYQYKNAIIYKLNSIYYNKVKNKYFSNPTFLKYLTQLNDFVISKLKSIKNIPNDKLFEISNIIISNNNWDYLIILIDYLKDYNLSIDDYIEIIDFKKESSINFILNMVSNNILNNNQLIFDIVGNYLNELNYNIYERIFDIVVNSGLQSNYINNFKNLSLSFPRSSIMYNDLLKKSQF